MLQNRKEIVDRDRNRILDILRLVRSRHSLDDLVVNRPNLRVLSKHYYTTTAIYTVIALYYFLRQKPPNMNILGLQVPDFENFLRFS